MSKLPPTEAKHILEAAKSLRDWPDCRQVKALANSDEYRLRVGDYRLIFTVRGDKIIITEVKRRNERTY